MSELRTCFKCGKERNIIEMGGIYGGKSVKFECLEDCQKEVRERAKKLREDKRKKELEIREKYKHLDKEEQFEAMFGLEFDDLTESPLKLRDASIHYRHKNGKKYSWCFAGNYWYAK